MSNILLAVDHKENSRLLLECLNQYHTVILFDREDILDPPFDLAIFDGHALNRLWQQIASRKEMAQPLFLPTLLISSHQDTKLMTRQLWRVVDELIAVPIEKVELLLRVEVLVRARRQSLELESKNIQLAQEIATRREAENVLRDSEERFRVTLKNSPLIVAHSDRDLRYTWVYNAHYFPYSTDMIGKQDTELAADAGLTRLTELKRQVLSSNTGTRREIEFKTSEQPVIYDVTVEPIYDVSGKPIGTTTAMFDITAQKRAEDQAAEMASFQERQRLARELHDSVSQTLFSATSIAQAASLKWEKEPQKARELLEDVVQLNRSALSEMRTLLVELRPEAIIKTRFTDLLQQLVEAAKGRNVLTGELVVSGEALRMPEDVHFGLYRIAQESINNILKHSGATHFTVKLNYTDDTVKMQIDDDGKGFDSQVQSAGMGLSNLRERARSIASSLALTSAPGSGTQVAVEWKIPQPNS